MTHCRLVAVAAVLLLASAEPASGAGLIWSIPAEGTSATYSGRVTQLVRRTDPTQQDVTLDWDRELVIRSLGTDRGEYAGAMVEGRWIELEQTTGKLQGGAVRPGPGGRVIVKLLVPNGSISGDVVDATGVPQSFIPIARGYRKVDDGPVEEIEAEAYNPAPEITLLAQPQSLSATGQTEGLSVGGRTLDGLVWTGEGNVESRRERVTTEVRLVRSADSPFGSAAWEVTSRSFEKPATAARDEFKPTTDATESMKLVEISGGAVGLLQTP